MPAMLEFLYVLRPTRADMLRAGPTPREADIISRHFAHLRDLCREGVVVLAGRTLTEDERTFGLCIVRAESAESAANLMRSDPAVAGGVMSAELFPFRTALLSGRDGPPPPSAFEPPPLPAD